MFLWDWLTDGNNDVGNDVIERIYNPAPQKVQTFSNLNKRPGKYVPGVAEEVHNRFEELVQVLVNVRKKVEDILKELRGLGVRRKYCCYKKN